MPRRDRVLDVFSSGDRKLPNLSRFEDEMIVRLVPDQAHCGSPRILRTHFT